MSTTIRVKKDTVKDLKSFLEEPYNFSSINEVIHFLMNKETLFELIIKEKPSLIRLISDVMRDEQVARLQYRIKNLKGDTAVRLKRRVKALYEDVDIIPDGLSVTPDSDWDFIFKVYITDVNFD